MEGLSIVKGFVLATHAPTPAQKPVIFETCMGFRDRQRVRVHTMAALMTEDACRGIVCSLALLSSLRPVP